VWRGPFSAAIRVARPFQGRDQRRSRYDIFVNSCHPVFAGAKFEFAPTYSAVPGDVKYVSRMS